MKSIQARILLCAFALAMPASNAFAGAHGQPLVAESPAAQDPRRQLLQALAVAARRHRGRHPAARHASHVRVREVEPDAGFAKTRATPRPVVVKPPKPADSGAIRRAVARENAERAARTEYLYRVSQTSAPIIANATACKRMGAHGESIYENCGVMAAASQDGAR